MIVNPIKDGVVLDHITAGRAMDIYRALKLDKLTCEVAMILNAESVKMGRKDILKICRPIDINLDVVGYLDPGITVNIIKDGKVAERKTLHLPERIEGIIRCTNPRCITSIEQELPDIFTLSDPVTGVYRCIYCESRYKPRGDLIFG